MNQEQTVLDIKKLFTALTGRSDQDIQITYKGTSGGVKLPWHVRIDSHETNALTCDAAVETLRDMLKASLQKKADDMERDARTLHQIVNSMKN